MGKLDGLSRCLGEEKSGIDANFFDEGQLLDHENNDVVDKEDVKDMELEGIDVITWEKKNKLYIVLQEYWLEVLR